MAAATQAVPCRPFTRALPKPLAAIFQCRPCPGPIRNRAPDGARVPHTGPLWTAHASQALQNRRQHGKFANRQADMHTSSSLRKGSACSHFSDSSPFLSRHMPKQPFLFPRPPITPAPTFAVTPTVTSAVTSAATSTVTLTMTSTVTSAVTPIETSAHRQRGLDRSTFQGSTALQGLQSQHRQEAWRTSALTSTVTPTVTSAQQAWRSPRAFCVRLRSSAGDGTPSEGAPPGHRRLDPPLPLVAPVVRGFGRGSRQMGFPTANMDPEQLGEVLSGLERGVYYGYAQLPEQGPDVYSMVCNIGLRPSFADGEGISIELHLLHEFKDEFYGEEIRALLLGFLRPETRFGSLDELKAQISVDIESSKELLGADEAKGLRGHHVFAKGS